MKSLELVQAKHAAIIYNPTAGRMARGVRSLQRTIEILLKNGIHAELVPTTGPGTASVQVQRKIEAGCDLVIAAGGDGTINEVVNGMAHSRVPLAILPGGTANVLARELRMPIHLEKAASQIVRLQPCRIAAGRLSVPNRSDRLFLLMAGAGVDAQVVYHLNLDLKAFAGKVAYYVGGFGQVFRPISEFGVTVDGKHYEASFALISRVRNYGGDLEIARHASLLRENFEIVLFQGKLSVGYLRYLLGVALKRADKMKGCTVLRGQTVTCHASPDDIYVQVDGELSGKLPFTAEIVPNAVTLLVPQAYLAREQSLSAMPALV